MTSNATSPEQYIKELPADRKEAITKMRDIILKNLPKGYEEQMTYGMLGWVVPLKTYPAGYHVNPKQPLAFACLASQKNFIALYHSGIYAMPELLKWFKAEYSKHTDNKLDMGKSCIRFKNPDKIPFKLIAELMKKVTVKEWIETYEENLARTKS